MPFFHNPSQASLQNWVNAKVLVKNSELWVSFKNLLPDNQLHWCLQALAKQIGYWFLFADEHSLSHLYTNI